MNLHHFGYSIESGKTVHLLRTQCARRVINKGIPQWILVCSTNYRHLPIVPLPFAIIQAWAHGGEGNGFYSIMHKPINVANGQLINVWQKLKMTTNLSFLMEKRIMYEENLKGRLCDRVVHKCITG